MRRDRWTRRLAAWDERCRVRLHRAANRVEDADRLEVGVAEAAVRVFDALDRWLAFREDGAPRVPEGVRGPLPPVVPNPAPPRRVRGGRER